jgi:hypothetical protein
VRRFPSAIVDKQLVSHLGYYSLMGEGKVRRKKRFDAVKHMKKLSRELLKSRKGKVIQSKKEKLLVEIALQESRVGTDVLESEH